MNPPLAITLIVLALSLSSCGEGDTSARKADDKATPVGPISVVEKTDNPAACADFSKARGVEERDRIAVLTAREHLVSKYGEKAVAAESPYHVYPFEHRWVTVIGTLPEDMVGGTYEVHLDKRSGCVLVAFHSQ